VWKEHICEILRLQLKIKISKQQNKLAKIKQNQVNAIKQILFDYKKPDLTEVAPHLYTLHRTPVLSKHYKPPKAAPLEPKVVNNGKSVNAEIVTKNIQEFINNLDPEVKIQHYKIDDDDDRVGLRGSYGVKAVQTIIKNEILAEYIGTLGTMAQLEKQYDDDLIKWSLIQRYLGTFNGDEEDKNCEIVISSFGDGNIACLINDCRKNPWKPLTSANTYIKQNALLVEFQTETKGIRRMFVVATKKIKPGSEILLDYGPHYWSNIKGDEKMLSVVHKLADSVFALSAGYVPSLAIDLDKE